MSISASSGFLFWNTEHLFSFTVNHLPWDFLHTANTLCLQVSCLFTPCLLSHEAIKIKDFVHCDILFILLLRWKAFESLLFHTSAAVFSWHATGSFTSELVSLPTAVASACSHLSNLSFCEAGMHQEQCLQVNTFACAWKLLICLDQACWNSNLFNAWPLFLEKTSNREKIVECCVRCACIWFCCLPFCLMNKHTI